MTHALGRVVLPDVFTPQWIRGTWEGSRGSRGLTTHLDNIHTELTLADDGISATSKVRGAITDPSSGEEVGIVYRKLELADDATLSVEHEYLELDDAAHGSGFARAFNDHAFERYADAGVDRVDIHAALSVGGYAWARQGFEINAPPGMTGRAADIARGAQLTQFVEDARSGGRISEDAYAELIPRLVTRHTIALPPDALVSVQELAAMPEVGKAVLLGSNWYGARSIDKTSNWWGAGSDAMQGARTLSAQLDAALPREMQRAGRDGIASALDGAGLLGSTPPISHTTLRVAESGVEPIKIAHTFELQDGSSARFTIAPEGDEIDGYMTMTPDASERMDPAALEKMWHDLGVTQPRSF